MHLILSHTFTFFAFFLPHSLTSSLSTYNYLSLIYLLPSLCPLGSRVRASQPPSGFVSGQKKILCKREKKHPTTENGKRFRQNASGATLIGQ
ncbi:hypothetical protein P167DRAFT_431101 [Morchella conica CCBAS932]|uniref:Secreted protein n=1 Tax=Morchella conica CCBAS932 TaxID=1392247 RepID=A0A3N4KXZ7_9PEZI|nr:hypothetical protein P167DRAFT_431101 [Morchella conica CCBAS932]